MRGVYGFALLLLGVALLPAACRADDPSLKTPQSKTAAANAPATKSARPRATPAPLSAEREAAALAFAHEYHPELAVLIEKLRQDNRRQFDRAIRELAQDRERLVRLKKQSPPHYDLALAAWKLDSRAHLLAARMTMSQDPSLEAELKHVLRDRVEVRFKQLQFERGRLQDRLAVVEKSIRKIEAGKDAMADADLQRIKRSVARSRRPAAKKPAPSESQSSDAPRPVVAQRPRVSADKSAASVTAPGSDSTNTQTKSKQD